MKRMLFFLVFPAILFAQTMLQQAASFRPDAPVSVGNSVQESTDDSLQINVIRNKKLPEFRSPYLGYLITSVEIRRAPLRNFQSFLEFQPGVIVQDGEIHLRGGRSGETGFYLNNYFTRNPLNGENSLYIIPEAISGIRVLPGGYSARYGNAVSGMVLTDLREGTSDFNFSVDFQTDKLANAGDRFLNTYTYRDHVLNMMVSGPAFSDKLKYFVAVENENIGDDAKRFNKSFAFHDLEDLNAAFNPGALGSLYEIAYGGGMTPFNSHNQWALNSTLLFEFAPFQIKLTGIYHRRRQYRDATPLLDLFNSRRQSVLTSQWLIGAELTSQLTENDRLEFRASIFQTRAENQDDYFGSDWKSWSDSSRVADYTGGEVIYRSRWTAPYPHLFNYAFSFPQNGSLLTDYFISRQNQIEMSADFIHQFHRDHRLSAGFSYRGYKLRQFSINPAAMVQTEEYKTMADVPQYIWSQYVGQSTTYNSFDKLQRFGYDLYGNEINNGPDGPKTPSFMAVYLEDYLTWHKFRLTTGLRFDYLDASERYLNNPASPEVNLGELKIEESQWRDKKPGKYFSPRILLEYSPDTKSVFSLFYGSFVQPPNLSDVYFSPEFFFRLLFNGTVAMVPIGFDLEPEKSNLFEIGIKRNLLLNIHAAVNGYVKNTENQPGVAFQKTVPTSAANNYIYLDNTEKTSVKGLEFSLGTGRIGHIMTRLNYAFSSAKGTASDENTHLRELLWGGGISEDLRPLDFAHRHNFLLNVDFRYKKGEGGKLLQRSGINVLFRMQSGHPYTLSDFRIGTSQSLYAAGSAYLRNVLLAHPLEPLNSSTTPWTHSVDLRIDKSFEITGDMEAQFYVRIINLFNTRNTINVYPATGDAVDDGFLSNPDKSGPSVETYGEGFADMYRAINQDNGQAYRDMTGNELFGTPRQIMVGVRFSR